MYSVIPLPDDVFDQPEQLGTKYKFWYHDESGRLCLFKEGRPNTGENWAEKVCCELCKLLGLPHADYEFATWKHYRGVVSPSFVPKMGDWFMGMNYSRRLCTTTITKNATAHGSTPLLLLSGSCASAELACQLDLSLPTCSKQPQAYLLGI